MTAAAETKPASALTRGDFSQLFLRSFLFQSLWSHQRMQNVGWLFSLWPVFRRIYADPAERSRAAQAHAEYFNTHPYTADIILGVAAGMEEKLALDPASAAPREAILSAKKAMSGPLSALGETVFWWTLRPLLLVAAALAGVFSARWGWILGPVLFLGVFNAAHVGVKAVGLVQGYRRGLDVAVFLTQWPVQRWTARAAFLGLGLSAGALATAALRSGERWPAVLLGAAVVAGVRRGLPAQAVPLLVLGAGLFTEVIR